MQRAIVLNPSYAYAHVSYGAFFSILGRVEEGVAEFKKARELDPLAIVTNRGLGVALYLAREYQAIEQSRSTLEMDPNSIWSHRWIGLAYLQKSMYKEGIAEFEKALAASPGSTHVLSDLGYGFALTGQKAEAQKVIDQLTELSKHKYIPAICWARIYIGLGDKGKAFQWLEKSYKDRSIGGLTFIKADPLYDPLRSDPRFTDLLRRMNLQP